jgi:cytochrome oxidase assembly protein ShyY1
VWSLLRSRRWIAFTLLVIVAITAFGLLSRWQWERAEEERQKRVAWATQAGEPALGLTEAAANPREWTPVRVSGRYDDGATVLVRQRPLDGRNGFWVVTPLDTADGRVWVNRGWIPVAGSATGYVPPPPAPAGTVIVEARLRMAESPSQTEPGDLPAQQVTHLAPERLGADIESIYLEATASSPADPDVLRIPPPAIDETQNISYALQWLAFAAVALTGWWYFLRREAREDSARAASSPEGVS